uniref:Uncharacterized protein n=1 Tax=Oncorhynchus tshawytscha TaxID=74940 RepID=A0A8C8MKR4_ONCTS
MLTIEAGNVLHYFLNEDTKTCCSKRNGEVHPASSFADLQLGLQRREGDCDRGGDEWAEEVQLTQQAVEAVNKLCRRPKFMVLCGDMVHVVFSGHYHRNARGGVVVVTADQINHRYHSLEQLSGRGMGEDLRKPLQV